jgi:hypothetical protein
MKKIIISSILVFSFILCASAQVGSPAQVDSVKAVQTTHTNALGKKTIVSDPLGQKPTNWSRIKDLFR